MEHFLPEELPLEIVGLIFDCLTVNEVLNLRLVSSKCRQSVLDYQPKLRRRVESRKVYFQDVSRLEEFCQVATTEFPLTRFKFKFSPNYELNRDLFQEFGSRFGSTVIGLSVKTIHICMGVAEQNFFSSLESLEELCVGTILEWDDAFVIWGQSNPITLGATLPNIPFSTVRCFKFEKVYEPMYLMILLEKCRNLNELHLGHFQVTTGNQRENVHVCLQRSICETIRTFLMQRENDSKFGKQLSVNFAEVSLESASLESLEQLGEAILRSRTKIMSMEASSVRAVILSLDVSQVPKFMKSVKCIKGFSVGLLSLPVSNLLSLELEISWTQLCSIEPESSIHASLENLTRINVACSVDRHSLRGDPQRNSCLQSVFDFLFCTGRKSVTSVKIEIPQIYESILVEPTTFPCKFANMRDLNIDIATYCSQEWTNLIHCLGQNCQKLQQLRLVIRCNVTDETFVGSNSFSSLKYLKQLDIEITLESWRMRSPLTDRLIREEISKTRLHCLKLRMWGRGVADFSNQGFGALTVGEIRKTLCHFECVNNRNIVENESVQKMITENCSWFVVDLSTQTRRCKFCQIK